MGNHGEQQKPWDELPTLCIAEVQAEILLIESYDRERGRVRLASWYFKRTGEEYH